MLLSRPRRTMSLRIDRKTRLVYNNEVTNDDNPGFGVINLSEARVSFTERILLLFCII